MTLNRRVRFAPRLVLSKIAPLCAGLFSIWIGTSCSGATDVEPPCDASIQDACWQYLGLPGLTISAVVQTADGIIAGTKSDGLYRRDGAGNWQRYGLPRRWITQLVPDGVGRLWATVVALYPDTTSAVLYVRTAAGEWRAVDGGISAQRGFFGGAFSMSVSHAYPGRVTVGLSAPIVRSDDDGATWRYVFGSQNIGGLAEFAVWESSGDGQRLYGACSDGIGRACFMRSLDGGTSWTRTLPWGELGPSAALDVQASARDERIVVVALPGGIARSTDGGDVWQQVATLPGPGTVWKIVRDSTQSMLAVVARYDSGVADHLAILRSTDDGATWTAFVVPTAAAGGYAASFAPGGDLLVGTSNGVWRLRGPPK